MNPRLPAVAARRIQRGLTLIECSIATAVVAAAAGAVMPGVSALRSQQMVANAAAAFETDVQHAPSLAVASGVTWRISFHEGSGASCYVVHSGSAGDCTCAGDGRAVCAQDAQALRTVWFGPAQPVALSANVRAMAFDPLKGTTTPSGTVRLQARNGAAVHQVVNVMGRVRSCSPDRTVAGYKAC